jgi:hypothetical protein
MQIKDGLVQGFRLFFMGGNIAAEDLKTEEAGANIGSAKSSYGQILKSSALIGGSSVINIMLGMVRTKVMAVLLGLGGIGLMGMYNSIVDTARTLSGMGMGSSGIRQIAEAAGNGGTEHRAVPNVERRARFSTVQPAGNPRACDTVSARSIESVGSFA